MSDVVERAKAALEGVTDGPWMVMPGAHGNVWQFPDEGQSRLIVHCGLMTPPNSEFIAAARTLVPELVEALKAARAERATHRRLSGQANYLLARVVAAANLGAIDGADGFIESYNLPVGPIHKAIPFLQEQGIIVTLDGQIKHGPEQQSENACLEDRMEAAQAENERLTTCLSDAYYVVAEKQAENERLAAELEAARVQLQQQQEAVIFADSILSLLRYRGLVDSEQNRRDVQKASEMLERLRGR